VTLIESTISENTAGDGGQGGLGGDGGRGGNGGGIDNRGTFVVVGSTLSGNAAGNGGGGYRGGGAFSTNGGSGGNGGGIRNHGSLTLVDTTVSGNSSGAGADGRSLAPDGDGGGIFADSAATLRNVTLSQNTARAGDGGGVAAHSLGIRFANSIVAGNSAADGSDCNGVAASNGFNLLGQFEGCDWFVSEGDRIGTAAAPIDPGLDTLRDNGGATLTHALLPGSAAIDGGDPTGCTDADALPIHTDQRGEPRDQDGDGDGRAACDIGAYEFPEAPR
jgi:hypothetical protein